MAEPLAAENNNTSENHGSKATIKEKDKPNNQIKVPHNKNATQKRKATDNGEATKRKSETCKSEEANATSRRENSDCDNNLNP